MGKLLSSLSPIFNRRSTKELKSITEAVDSSLSTSKEDIDELIKTEYNIATSTGEWLEEWASWFGLARSLDESDIDFASRVIASVTKPKSTIPAIKSSIKSLADYKDGTVDIFEPHVQVAKHGVAKFSGTDKYLSGDYWRWNVIDILVSNPVTEDLKKVVEEIKSSGIKVYYTNGTVMSMDPTDDGFKHYLALAGESNAIIQIAPGSFIKGDKFSVSSPVRGRSGLKTSWGVYLDRGIEVTPSDYSRISGESVSLSPEDFTITIVTPLLDTSTFSKKRGIRSGNPINRYKIESVYDPAEITSRQGDVQHQSYNMRPATRSDHGGRSSTSTMSGVPGPGGEWAPKPFLVVPQDFAAFDDPPDPIDTITIKLEPTVLEIGMASFSSLGDITHSGRRKLWDISFVGYNLSAGYERYISCAGPYTIGDLGNIPVGEIINFQNSVEITISN